MKNRMGISGALVFFSLFWANFGFGQTERVLNQLDMVTDYLIWEATDVSQNLNLVAGPSWVETMDGSALTVASGSATSDCMMGGSGLDQNMVAYKFNLTTPATYRLLIHFKRDGVADGTELALFVSDAPNSPTGSRYCTTAGTSTDYTWWNVRGLDLGGPGILYIIPYSSGMVIDKVALYNESTLPMDPTAI